MEGITTKIDICPKELAKGMNIYHKGGYLAM